MYFGDLSGVIEGVINLFIFLFWACFILVFIGIPGACPLGYLIGQ